MPKKILLVEPDPRLAQKYCALLAEVGKECITASDLLNARTIIEGGQAQVAIVDMDTIGLEPWKTLEIIIKIMPPIPVCVITETLPDGELLAIGHGAQEFLLKSEINGPRLLLSVRRAFLRFNYRQIFAKMYEKIDRAVSEADKLKEILEEDRQTVLKGTPKINLPSESHQ